ncbi:MAG: hypothetical protein RSD51_03205 [Malacoplasma sp.]
MSINDILSVDKRFQKSINLKYDLKDINKIKNYIPTSSSLEVLKSYVNDLLDNNSQKSTVLVGPYGKGKSHMLLMLIALFSLDNDKLILDLLKKVARVDLEAYAALSSVREQKVKYLPLIVSNTQKDFNQSVLFALIESLKREGIMDLVPNTNYSEAIKKIELWEKEFPQVYNDFKSQIKNVNKFKSELVNLRVETYNQFLEVHKLLTAGTEFNPMINMEITVLLEAVNRKLVDEYGYKGIIILFDEFSKYLEASNDDSIANEIKIIQDICELANSSKDYKIFNIFVMHKKIQEYNRELSIKVKNAFKSIEGRIEYKEFYTTSKNNYELIGDVLIKNKEYDLFKRSSKTFKELCKSTRLINAFNAVFEDSEIEQTILDNCYPLTPLAACLLLKISERIGQNERTVFTFLSSTEENGLLDIILKNPSLEYIDASYIYDYFANLIATNRNEMYMYQTNIQLQAALRSVKDENKQKYLKTLALIYMINDFDNVNTSPEYLANGLACSSDNVREIYNELERIGILGKKRNVIVFKTKISLSIEEDIKNIINTKLLNVSFTDVLNKIEKSHYVISRNYNNEYKMTRFFEKIYMTYNSFNKLPNFDMLFENSFSDGKIIYLLLNETEYKEKINISDDRIIIIKMRVDKNIESIAKKYLAVDQLLKNTNDEIIKNELYNISNDFQDEIRTIITNMMFFKNKYRSIIIKDKELVDISFKEFDMILYSSLVQVYPKTPIINYELINKQKVSGAYKKARELVINSVLEYNYGNYILGTSAEASLYRATLYFTGLTCNEILINDNLKEVIIKIKEMILSHYDFKLSFLDIYSTMQSSPYGIRKGVIPIYIAFVVANLDVDITFYMDNQEIDLSANLFELINEHPEKYYYLIEKKSNKREVYLNNLESEFDDYGYKWKEGISRYKRIVLSMQAWLNSLPKVTSQSNDFVIEGKIYPYTKLKTLINRVDINSRDMIFNELVKVFDEDYDQVINDISIIKKYMNNYIVLVRIKVEKEIRAIFKFNSDNSLISALKDWFIPYSQNTKFVSFTSKTNSFVNVIRNIDNLSNNQILDKLSTALVGMYIEDYNNNTLEEFKQNLVISKENVENLKVNDLKGEFRVIIKKGEDNVLEKIYDHPKNGIAEYMINELEEILEQYGDSIDTESKIAILASLIQKVSNN